MSSPRSLLFGWPVAKFWNWRLAFFFAVALIVHVSAFYVFQVVYPPTEPISVQPMRVVVLDPAIPAAADLLRELEDRAFAYGPGVNTDLPDFSLAKLGATFRPSFQDHEIALLPVDSLSEAGVSALLSSGQVDLPPLPVAPDWKDRELPEVPAEGVHPRIRVGPQLASRILKVDGAALARALRQPNGRLKAQAGVMPDGRLLYLLISEEPEGGLAEAEVEILRETLRFEPGEALQQDWIEIIW